MSTTKMMSAALGATCLALASFCATAQTAAPQTAAPPTHPAAGAADAGTTGPTMPPTHPATAHGSGGANPSVNGYKESTPPAEDARRGAARTTSKPAPGSTERNPTSTDSMAKDNLPKHPAAPAK